MSIVKPVIPDDPFGAFAWKACMANLALQRVRDRIPLDPEESKALTELSRDVSDLTMVMHQGVTALLLKLDKRLIDLSRLVVGPGAQAAGREFDFDQIREDLCRVVENPAVPLNDVLLERMQGAINEMIERANRFRPQADRSPLIECVA